MPEPIPQPGDLSGYITNTLRWMWSVWDSRASWLGVYLWEYFNIVLPVLSEQWERERS